MESLKTNLDKIFSSLKNGNCFNEEVTVVGATKMQSAEIINEAVSYGLKDVGENFVQEFKEKCDKINGAKLHFIGHLQTNKVKYLIGKIDLYQSVDRMELAAELSKRSVKSDLTSNILLQVNIGSEESKGGFEYDEAYDAYKKINEMSNLKILGFMAMLPNSDNEELLINLTKKMRALYDRVKSENEDIKYLSMGMSGDYKLCVENGSNMIRIGTTIFGERDYSKKTVN